MPLKTGVLNSVEKDVGMVVEDGKETQANARALYSACNLVSNRSHHLVLPGATSAISYCRLNHVLALAVLSYFTLQGLSRAADADSITENQLSNAANQRGESRPEHIMDSRYTHVSSHSVPRCSHPRIPRAGSRISPRTRRGPDSRQPLRMKGLFYRTLIRWGQIVPIHVHKRRTVCQSRGQVPPEFVPPFSSPDATKEARGACLRF